MSTFIVQAVEARPPFTTSFGGQLYPFQMAGLLDGNLESAVSINVKDPARAPKVGETIDCLVEQRNQYGVKIKKNMAPAAPQSQTQIPGGTPTAPQQYQREDPLVRQASIERQNSLTNAIAFCTAKANALVAAKKAEEAVKYLEGKHVLQVATYFNSYNNGKLTVVMTPEEVAEAFGYEAPAENSALDIADFYDGDGAHEDGGI